MMHKQGLTLIKYSVDGKKKSEKGRGSNIFHPHFSFPRTDSRAGEQPSGEQLDRDEAGWLTFLSNYGAEETLSDANRS